MQAIELKSLIEAGVHFGHRASRWHPAMEPYIYGRHNQIHVVDLRETMRGLIRASHFLANIVEAGHDIVFVGTKPQAREVVREQAKRCGQHFVVNRWLGGTLTNFNTIRSRLKRLEELEAMEADGTMELRSKKEVSRLMRERRKIHRNLEGIRRLTKQPGAIIATDVRRDHIAIAEARLLGIPVVAICDTDNDPRRVDLPIPGNDDAYRSLEVLLQTLSDAILQGRDKLVERLEIEEKKRQEEREKAAKAKEEAEKKRAAQKADQEKATAAAPAAAEGEGDAAKSDAGAAN